MPLQSLLTIPSRTRSCAGVACYFLAMAASVWSTILAVAMLGVAGILAWAKWHGEGGNHAKDSKDFKIIILISFAIAAFAIGDLHVNRENEEQFARYLSEHGCGQVPARQYDAEPVYRCSNGNIITQTQFSEGSYGEPDW
ncbi:hypothetical protein [Massilia sp. X63]|uniref:hypothetical protein n=1 Tax=Massilia sp. X63 TaxID=3237285 RepID=UPI0034DDB405